MITIWPVWGESIFCLPLPGADQRVGWSAMGFVDTTEKWDF